MDIILIIKILFSGLSFLEIVAILALSIVTILIILAFSVITKIYSITGLITVCVVVIFSTLAVRGTFLAIQSGTANVEDSEKANPYSFINFLNRYDTPEKIEKLPPIDNGKEIKIFPKDRDIVSRQYTKEDARNSLDKIYKTYGVDTIIYMQNMILKAKKLKDNNNVIYLSLNDYANICSMNLCNKYYYEFNDVKEKTDEFYLVLLLPVFKEELEYYMP